MKKIANAIQNISTLKVLNINNNNVGEEAADDITTVLSHNMKLQKLFMTVGMNTIVKALQHKTLIVFNISNNNVNEEAADDIVTVLSRNTQLKELDIHNNNKRCH